MRRLPPRSVWWCTLLALHVTCLAPEAVARPGRKARRIRPDAVVIRVNDDPVTYRDYRRIQAAGKPSYDALASLPGGGALPEDLTREEATFRFEHAELSAMLRLFREQDAAHRETAWELYRRARAGEDWGTLVQAYTTEPGAWATKGDMGAVGFHNLVWPYNRVMFAAPLGEVQPPVRTVFGWHVGKVLEIVPAQPGRQEVRRVSQALILWQTPRDGGGMEVDLRVVIAETMRHLRIDVLEPQLCGELPHFCANADAAASGAAAGAR
jgi:hypothetical protein